MKLNHIFKKYKKEYNLRTKLVFDPEFVYAKAIYYIGADTIVFGQNIITADNIVILLHEIGHALQNKKGKLLTYSDNINAAYALEREAQNFALKEFYAKYKHVGKRTRRSCLKSKKRYAKFLKFTPLKNGIKSSS